MKLNPVECKKASVAFISSDIPNIKHGGGAVTSYSIIESLLKLYSAVFLIVLNNDNRDDNLEKIYNEKNIKIIYLNSKQSILSNTVQFLKKILPFLFKFSSINYYGKPKLLRNIIIKYKFDIVFSYHWEAIICISGLRNVTTIGLAGDPINLPYRFRRIEQNIKNKNFFNIKNIYRLYFDYSCRWRVTKDMINILNNLDHSGLFACHHASELSKLGANACKYIKTPISDDLLPDIDIKRTNNAFNILMVGHLTGIATTSGINLFLDEIMPNLSKNLTRNFYVTIVGDVKKADPKILEQISKFSNIILKGQVDDLYEEYINSDLLLVPTPIELGIRVRIITAFAHGALVVTHKSNQKGIPELNNLKNCLIGNNGKELSQHILDVCNKKINIKKIKQNAFLTYKNNFSTDVFASSIKSWLK